MGEAFATTIRRKTVRLFAVTMSPMLGLLGAYFALDLYTSGPKVLAFMGVLLAYGGLVAHSERRLWKKVQGQVSATAEGLFVDGQLEVPRAWVRRAMAVRVKGRWDARLVRDNLRIVDIEVVAERDAALLFDAMHLDASRWVTHHTFHRGTWARALRVLALDCAALLVICASTFAIGLRWGWAAAYTWQLLTSLVIVAHLAYQSTAISVGPDGIDLRCRLGRKAFHSFRDVEGATVEGNHLTLAFRDGTRLVFHGWLTKSRWLPSWLHEDISDLVERINARVVAHRILNSGIAALLTRTGRDTRSWLRDLTLASDRHASFRAPALPAEMLWSVVEDTTAPASARAGAAIALAERRDAERLRRVADACASPRLSQVLARLAEGADPSSFVQQLEALD